MVTAILMKYVAEMDKVRDGRTFDLKIDYHY